MRRLVNALDSGSSSSVLNSQLGDLAWESSEAGIDVKTAHYQLFTVSNWNWGHDPGRSYEEDVSICTLGLAGEAGEVAELIKKSLRGDGPVDREKLTKELGDVQFYLARLAAFFDIDLDSVMYRNVIKLKERRAKGTLRGNGSDR